MSQGSFVKVQNFNVNDSAFVFEPFTHSIGLDIGITTDHANCQIGLNIKFPTGLQYGATGTTYTAYAGDEGIRGAFGTTYYFAGSTTQDGPKYSLEGLLDSKYNITQNVEDASIARQDIVWSPCGSPVPLNINNRITLTSTNDAGYGYIQSDGNLAANLIWRKCT